MVRAAILRAIAGHTGDHEIVPRPALPHQSNRLYDVWIDGQHVIAKEYLRADRQGRRNTNTPPCNGSSTSTLLKTGVLRPQRRSGGHVRLHGGFDVGQAGSVAR
jgi:hypothetical protein